MLSQARPDHQVPPIVVFAPAARLGAVAPACGLAAAVVIAGDTASLNANAANAVRADGCPMMVAGDTASAHGFDGLHLEADNADAIKTARRELTANTSLGVGSAATRHQAMMLGEGLPDYVLFGRVGAGERPDRAADPELIGWWSELFEIASVALATDVDEARALVDAGADFVAVHNLLWRDSDPAEALRALAKALAEAQPAEIEAVG